MQNKQKNIEEKLKKIETEKLRQRKIWDNLKRSHKLSYIYYCQNFYKKYLEKVFWSSNLTSLRNRPHFSSRPAQKKTKFKD